jgi:hypothetical protein
MFYISFSHAKNQKRGNSILVTCIVISEHHANIKKPGKTLARMQILISSAAAYRSTLLIQAILQLLYNTLHQHTVGRHNKHTLCKQGAPQQARSETACNFHEQ